MSLPPITETMTVEVGVERDVQHILIDGIRKRRRPWGYVPYPVKKYTTELASLDIWDNIFFESIWGSLTVYNFLTPPAHVLDLGCGSGWWVMEMAKRWPVTQFVGFDVAKVQPDFKKIPNYSNIADRITWVNGNFLDIFPFLGETFDYVRVCRLGMAIPEDEWQYVLEDIWRVMKTGAILEIIEEDLIFPCTTVPMIPSPQIPSPKLNSSQSSTSLGAPCSNHLTVPSPSRTRSSIRKRLTSIVSLNPSKVSLQEPGELERERNPIHQSAHDSHVESTIPLVPEVPPEYLNHPQNHLRMKAAWDAVLIRRFISNKPLSILPFYLSTLFSGVESFHLYTVPLPTNTTMKYDVWDDDDSLYTTPRIRRRMQISMDFPTKKSNPVPINPEHTISHPIVTDLPRLQAMDLRGLAGMHLHYVVDFIKGCKEAIREEYVKMFPEELCSLKRDERSLGDGFTDMFCETRRLDSFEVDWNDWVYDMEDRMHLRQRISEYLSWDEPRNPRGGKPRWRHWRKSVDQQLENQHRTVFEYPPDPNNICRSARAFMAWKDKKPAPAV